MNKQMRESRPPADAGAAANEGPRFFLCSPHYSPPTISSKAAPAALTIMRRCSACAGKTSACSST
eukprot:scaffold9199_cov17-Tisochrysis_lutea.AAC.1